MQQAQSVSPFLDCEVRIDRILGSKKVPCLCRTESIIGVLIRMRGVPNYCGGVRPRPPRTIRLQPDETHTIIVNYGECVNSTTSRIVNS